MFVMSKVQGSVGFSLVISHICVISLLYFNFSQAFGGSFCCCFGSGLCLARVVCFRIAFHCNFSNWAYSFCYVYMSSELTVYLLGF